MKGGAGRALLPQNRMRARKEMIVVQPNEREFGEESMHESVVALVSFSVQCLPTNALCLDRSLVEDLSRDGAGTRVFGHRGKKTVDVDKGTALHDRPKAVHEADVF